MFEFRRQKTSQGRGSSLEGKGYVPFSDTHLELVAQEGRVLGL